MGGRGSGAVRNKATTIDTWYDRRTRSWVVQRKDENGNQVGEADYVGTKAERDYLVSQYQKSSSPTTKAFSLTEKIFREDKEGYVFSKTSSGDLYLGNKNTTFDDSAVYMKDTPENRKSLNSLFEVYSTSKEIKRRKG